MQTCAPPCFAPIPRPGEHGTFPRRNWVSYVTFERNFANGLCGPRSQSLDQALEHEGFDQRWIITPLLRLNHEHREQLLRGIGECESAVEPLHEIIAARADLRRDAERRAHRKSQPEPVPRTRIIAPASRFDFRSEPIGRHELDRFAAEQAPPPPVSSPPGSPTRNAAAHSTR